MNTTRVVLYFAGIALVILALFMLYFETGINRWIPAAIAIAALLLIIGVSIMSFAEKSRGGMGEGGDVNINKRVEERHIDVGEEGRRTSRHH